MRSATSTLASSIVLAVLAVLFGCAGHAPDSGASGGSAEPVPVVVETLRLAASPEVHEAVGTVHARSTARISSRIAAYIRQVHAEVGDEVRAGETLVELDGLDLAADLEDALAATTEGGHAVEEAAHALEAAEADLHLARLTHERFTALLGKKSVSQHEYDQVAARLESARAGVELAQARERQAGARLAQLEARRRAAEIEKGYASLKAPFAGVVTERFLDPGSLAAPGVPILAIDEQGEHRLEASVSESHALALRAGQTVTVRLDAVDEDVEGRITEVSPSVDPRSRTVIVKIALAPHRSLRSGTFGRVLFATSEREGLTVPEDAVLERGQVHSVFVVEDNVARRRLVTVGVSAGGRYEVLSGLRADETVIVNPRGVGDGAAVRVERVRTGEEARS